MIGEAPHVSLNMKDSEKMRLEFVDGWQNTNSTAKPCTLSLLNRKALDEAMDKLHSTARMEWSTGIVPEAARPLLCGRIIPSADFAD
jgi:hypothetical protein